MLTRGCCHFSGKPSTKRLSGSEVSLKKMCYEILPALRSVRMTLPRKLNDLWVNSYIITMFYGKHNRQVWFLLFSYVKIWPYLFFPYILVKVAHLAAAEFQHLVIEILAVSVDKAVGEFVDAERL